MGDGQRKTRKASQAKDQIIKNIVGQFAGREPLIYLKGLAYVKHNAI